MNNLPAIVPKTPEWFLGELEDILGLLRRSDNKKKNSIVKLSELSYILTLPQRLFQSGFIDAEERNNFNKSISKFYNECRSSYTFLVKFVFYMYQAGYFKHDVKVFKEIRDTLTEKIRAATKTQESTQKQVATIMSVDKKYFPEVLPGEVVGPDGAIIDTIYQGLENTADTMIALLYSGEENFSLHLPEVFNFFGELLSLGYIDADVYEELALSENRSYAASVCIGFLYAIRGGFYDYMPGFRDSFMPLIREYLLDNRELEIISIHIDSSK